MSGSALMREEAPAGTNNSSQEGTTKCNGKSWDSNSVSPGLKSRFRIWASSFVRLDPRYRIHRFFQGIAQIGELKLQDADYQKKKRESLSSDDPSHKHKELLTKCFNMASVFTVWRPCSSEAIRKMMEGKGVGKGLDIKGKSAKFGRCSGYVPFMQIHNDEDKKKIDILPRDAKMRIFYTSMETRQLAVDVLIDVREEMVDTVEIDQDSMSLLRYSFVSSPRTSLEAKDNNPTKELINGKSQARDRIRRPGVANMKESVLAYPRTNSTGDRKTGIHRTNTLDVTPLARVRRMQTLDDCFKYRSNYRRRSSMITDTLDPTMLRVKPGARDSLMSIASSPMPMQGLLGDLDTEHSKLGSLLGDPDTEHTRQDDSDVSLGSLGVESDDDQEREIVRRRSGSMISINQDALFEAFSSSQTSIGRSRPQRIRSRETVYVSTEAEKTELLSGSRSFHFNADKEDLDEQEFQRGGDHSLLPRRHSMSASERHAADVALKRQSSKFSGVGSSRESSVHTTSMASTNQELLMTSLQRNSSGGRRTSSVMEYCEASQRRQAWEMEDSSITLIDDYADQMSFGIEVSERLFWEAFVMRQDDHCRLWPIAKQAKKGHDLLTEDSGSSCGDHHTQDRRSTTRKPQRNFAQKLMHQMISMEDEREYISENQNHSFEWVKEEGGYWSFVIVDKDRFVEEVLRPIRRKDEEAEIDGHPATGSFPTKYSSFAGELRRIGFVYKTTGKGCVRFQHGLFRKDKPWLCSIIGTEHDTGRGSVSSFQDANFKSLRQKVSAAGHRVVLFNMEDEQNPLCPHNLLVAYEEHGRVVPVVSDFDGFLVGTKRIKFDQPLPPEQVEVLEGCILSARDILEGKAMGSTWTEKWMYASRDHLGQTSSRCNAKKRPKMPKFGYGDAKSYRLMEGAVAQLAKVDGAVRHGAECFNYMFPQEIDQTFLIISDTLDGNVRWKYVDSVKLHYFLSSSVDDGYAFPLNPKWVLCDPGWSKIYDKLLQSSIPSVQQSLDVWFPPKIRKMIADIQARHTTGLKFADPNGRGNMGLPCIAKYNLRGRKLHDRSLDPDLNDSVKLWIDRGSVIHFSKPGFNAGIVCATNESCVPICGGVTQALTGAGGRELLEDVKALPILYESSFGPCRCVTGSAKIVSRKDDSRYGNLDVSHVIYAVGPAYGETYSSDNEVSINDGLLRDAYKKSLQCAKENGLEVVAFSLLSAGKRSSRWDPHRSLRIAVRTISDYEDFGSIKEVHMCAFTAAEVAALENIAHEFGLTPATNEHART